MVCFYTDVPMRWGEKIRKQFFDVKCPVREMMKAQKIVPLAYDPIPSSVLAITELKKKWLDYAL